MIAVVLDKNDVELTVYNLCAIKVVATDENDVATNYIMPTQ